MADEQEGGAAASESLTFADLAEAKLYVYAVMGAAVDNELHDPEGWIFGGMLVARNDDESCGARARSGYMCTRVPGHDGPHVAHVFRVGGTGRPNGVVDAWEGTKPVPPSLAGKVGR